MSIEFLVTTLVVVLLPGAGVLYTLAIGLSQGSRAAIIAAFGCTLGIVPHVAASIVGLAALLHASALAFQTLKYLGVLYLFWMAWNIWREGGALQVDGAASRQSARRIITQAVLINSLNPKLTLFFFAFMPQFVVVDAPDATRHMLELALVFMAMTFAVFAVYGICAGLARDHVISRPAVMRWLRRSFAACFGLVGLRLALSGR